MVHPVTYELTVYLKSSYAPPHTIKETIDAHYWREQIYTWYEEGILVEKDKMNGTTIMQWFPPEAIQRVECEVIREH